MKEKVIAAPGLMYHIRDGPTTVEENTQDRRMTATTSMISPLHWIVRPVQRGLIICRPTPTVLLHPVLRVDTTIFEGTEAY